MRRGPILLKCEVIGVLLNIQQKISRKQYVSIILIIHLCPGCIFTFNTSQRVSHAHLPSMPSALAHCLRCQAGIYVMA